MKKYLTFFLLILMSIGSVAQTTTTPLHFGDEGVVNKNWNYRVITDINGQLKEFDYLVISFDAATNGNQYAICSATEKDGDNYKKLVVFSDTQNYFDCEAGQTECTVKITSDLLKAINSGGLRFEYNGLKNIKASIKRLNIDWSILVPKDAESIGKNLPYKITDWYSKPYVLLQDGNFEAVGKTLRVICVDAGDDAYAFLKKNDASWNSIMSGSDKFSIAGWRYFDIKVNNELNDIIKNNNNYGGLLIGGNNYTIYGIYLYGNKQDDSSNTLAWKEDDTDVIDTYTIEKTTEGKDGWVSAEIPGAFFEYKGQTGNQEQGSGVSSTTKLANTKNNIIRLVFDGQAPEGAQVSAKDTENNCEAAYIRQRRNDLKYVNFADCAYRDHYDFELSDAITIFENFETVKTGAEGVKTGMLSKLLRNGMNVGAKGVKIKSVQIRKSLISKYVKGYAELTGHALSASKWCSITFPYNLTHDQLTKAFGGDVRICELGSSEVKKDEIKTGVNKGSYHYSILFNFKKIGKDEGVNANYPYLIKLGSTEHEKDDNVYPIKDVVADVRDFQAYEFRSGKFNLDALDEATKSPADQNKTVVDKEKEIIAALSKDNVCMKFKSTAPVFNISNTSDDSETKVEIINGVANGGFTLLTPPTPQNGDTYYYMRNGALWPVLTQNRRLASGRAYVILPQETKVLFEANGQADTPNESKSIIAYSIDDEGGNTTGIDEMEFSAPVVRQAQQNVYSLNGQMIRKGVSTVGLPKGIYIVGGKKLIVK